MSPPRWSRKESRGIKLSFEPADIVNEVMSFGSPTPIEIAVSGPKMSDNQAFAEKVRQRAGKNCIAAATCISCSRSGLSGRRSDRDRELAGASGITAEGVANSLVAATSSSRFLVPNYWADPNTGIGYQVQVEIPIARMDSAAQIGVVPIGSTNTPTGRSRGGSGVPMDPAGQVFLQDVARIHEGTVPGEYDRYNMKRLISMTANIEGEDLGRVARHVSAGIAGGRRGRRAARPVDVRGQIVPMQQMFGALAGGKIYEGLTAGLLLAVVVILLLLAAYFQSFRLALAVVCTLPAVLAGVVLVLWATRTTLNIQSFMGSIMAIGVAVANAILSSPLPNEPGGEGASASDAAIDGARHRVRPILMTSCAMIAGMIPMALATRRRRRANGPACAGPSSAGSPVRCLRPSSCCPRSL